MNARARALVLEFGSSASSYQILNPGMAHWFSAADDAVVGYAQHHGFRVVAGGPVCADSRLSAVMTEFERDAKLAGLRVCYFAAERHVVAAVGADRTRRGLLRLGAQPVWHPARWEGAVLGHASLRAQLRRATNKSVVVRELPVHSTTRIGELERCLNEWLATRRAPTMHFLVEPRTLDSLGDRRTFVAERDGRAIAFLVASPVPRRDGWLIEQIIRGSGAVNGTTELLVDAAIRALDESGSQYVTLGLSPLSTRSSTGEVPTALWQRLLLGWLRAHGRRFYNFEGLDAFKAKLRPEEWEPIYAVSDRGSVSPDVLYAIAAAFTQGTPVAATLRALGWAVRQEARSLLRRRR